MKIHIISFDYWGYDTKIANKLNNMGHQTVHIKLSDFHYKYPNLKSKISNFFSKIFFKKNIKKIKTEEYILNQLETAGIQDSIIVINPERISKNCHLQIKRHTKSYIAYLYDSIDRYNNIDLITNTFFDKIFTFDKIDAKKHNLVFLPNYIHLEKRDDLKNPKHKVFSISSIDERYQTINSFIEYFDNNNITHETIFFDKKKPSKLKNSATFIKQKLTQNQIQEKIEDATIVLDVLRKNQTGLSFRIFDALALNKKIITTNKSIKEYDFYNPKNIFVWDKNSKEIPKSFFDLPCEELDGKIIEKYSLKNWVTTLLEIT